MSYTVFLFFVTAILCWLYLAVSSRLTPHMVLVVASLLHLCVIIAIWMDGRNALRAYHDEEMSSCRLRDLEKDINDIRDQLIMKLDKVNKSLSVFNQMHPQEVRSLETVMEL